MKCLYRCLEQMSWTSSGFTFDVAFVCNNGASGVVTVSVAGGTSQASFDNAVQTAVRAEILSKFGVTIAANSDMLKQG